MAIPNRGSNFVTREVEIPESPVSTPPSSPARSRTSSLHSTGRNSQTPSKAIVPPLPAIPTSLLDALAREPPPSNNARGSSVSSTQARNSVPQPGFTLPTAIYPSKEASFSLNSTPPSSSQSSLPPTLQGSAGSPARRSTDNLPHPSATPLRALSPTPEHYSNGVGIDKTGGVGNVHNMTPPKKSIWKNAGSAWSRFNGNARSSTNGTGSSTSSTNSRNSSLNSRAPSGKSPRGSVRARDSEEEAILSRTSLSQNGRPREKDLDDDSSSIGQQTDGSKVELDVNGAASPWGKGRMRGERYTRDLDGGHAYESDVDNFEEGGEEVSLHEDTIIQQDELTLTPKGKAEAHTSSSIFARRRLEGENGPRVTVPTGTISSGHSTAPLNPSRFSPTFNRTSSGMPKDRSWSAQEISSVAEGLTDALDPESLARGMGIPLGESETPKSVEDRLQFPRAKTADFVVAVVGPRNVGKSTVIRRGLKRPLAAPVVIAQDDKDNRVTTCTSVFSIAGQNKTVEVLEIDMALLRYNSEGVIWPAGLSQCEGAMLCYDATDPKALDSLSLLLQAFWTRGSDVPLIVLACKSLADESLNATDPIKASEICNVYGAGIVALDGGPTDPEKKMKDSFNWMIRAIMLNRGDIPLPEAYDLMEHQTDSVPPTPPSVTSKPMSQSIPRSSLDQQVSQKLRAGSSGLADESFSSKMGEDQLRASVSTEQPGSPKTDSGKNSKSAGLDLHFSREDMIDKFLFASVTGNDEQYVTLFLIVYRRFARPYDVLTKLIERFEFVWGRLQSDPLLSRFAQMKLCGVLSTWFQVYPGDFTAPATFNLLQPFLDDLLPRGATWVAHYAIELVPLLATVSSMTDPEGSWAIPDKPMQDPALVPGVEGPRRPSLVPSFGSESSAGPSHFSDSLSLEGHQSRLSVPSISAPADANAANSSILESHRGSLTEGGGPNGQDLKILRAPAFSSTLLELSNALTELPADSIATQITRVAWEAFAEMTPRDLIRHVLAPRDFKNPDSVSLYESSNVMRSITFVNYLADWVSSMILIQPKIKYRAKILEQFIAIAGFLREQENFDSLMGVLAGLNSQPVFRLAETMEATHLLMDRDRQRLSPEARERTKIPKKLRSLNKLMATAKSFAAYRLALSTSGANMIPYIGVHLQDITIVNEVKSDMRDGKVNWSKFSQMGRSAAIVLDCARLAPTLDVDRGIEKCILHVPIMDNERQYELSFMYEPRKGDANSSRKGLRQLFTSSTFS